MTAVYAVSDTHGYVDELRAALEAEGLIEGDHWTGRDARCRTPMGWCLRSTAASTRAGRAC